MPRFFTPSLLRFLGVVALHGALGAGARSIAWVGAVAPPPEPAAPITVKLIARQPTRAVIDGANEVRKRNAGDGYIYGLECSFRVTRLPEN